MRHFAYGSNMDPRRMREEKSVRFSRRVHAILRGYFLEFNKVATRKAAKKGEGKANIVPDAREIVEGAYYEVPDEDSRKLDVSEGYPDHYDKVSVTVTLDDGTAKNAVAYIAQPVMTKPGLKPTRKYLNYLLAGRDILSPTYFQKLKSFETID